MSDLTARELLEEALTHITAPVGKSSDGEFFTRWCTGDEFAGSSLLKSAVTIMDPDGVWDDKDYPNKWVRYRTMCAIGALALASLTQKEQRSILRGTATEWKGWGQQNNANPEVALATIALIYVASEQPAMHQYVSESMNNKNSIWTSFWQNGRAKTLVQWMKASKQERAEFASRFVGFIANYNDDHCTSYLDAAEMFQSAIKLLIEAEGAL